jgi:hypothetical protein
LLPKRPPYTPDQTTKAIDLDQGTASKLARPLERRDQAMGDLPVLFKHSVPIALVAVVYFLPSIIARVNGLRSSIYVINLFLGWTVLGWLIALSLALSEMYEKQCPACAAWVDRRVTTCPYCDKPLNGAESVRSDLTRGA